MRWNLIVPNTNWLGCQLGWVEQESKAQRRGYIVAARLVTEHGQRYVEFILAWVIGRAGYHADWAIDGEGLPVKRYAVPDERAGAKREEGGRYVFSDVGDRVTIYLPGARGFLSPGELARVPELPECLLIVPASRDMALAAGAGLRDGRAALAGAILDLARGEVRHLRRRTTR